MQQTKRRAPARLFLSRTQIFPPIRQIIQVLVQLYLNNTMHWTLPSIPLPPLHGLGPVLLPDSHTLVLCSYPGKEALEKQEYYAGRNQFWKLMSAVLNESLIGKPYADRLNILLSHRIGLWDVISACQSKGPLKQVLAEDRPDRFAFLKSNCPSLQKICLNGQPAGEYAPLFEAAGYATLILPSSSPAYSRQPLEKKFETWRRILSVDRKGKLHENGDSQVQFN